MSPNVAHWCVCVFFKNIFQTTFNLYRTAKQKSAWSEKANTRSCYRRQLSMLKLSWKSISITFTSHNNNYLLLFTNSRPTHRTLCRTVPSLHTCHPRRNYFPITPPPLPKVCRARPTSHSEVSRSLSLPLILSLSKLMQYLPISSPMVSKMLVEQLTTGWMWSDVQ